VRLRRLSRPVLLLVAALSLLLLLPVVLSLRSRGPSGKVPTREVASNKDVSTPRRVSAYPPVQDGVPALAIPGAFAQVPATFTAAFMPEVVEGNQSRTQRTEGDVSVLRSVPILYSPARQGMGAGDNGRQYQLFGVRVQGPILSGSALARDISGNPVASLNQPNLLTAGRGFLPLASAPPDSDESLRGRGSQVEARRTTATRTREGDTSEQTSDKRESEAEDRDQPIQYRRGVFEFSGVESSKGKRLTISRPPETTPLATVVENSNGEVEVFLLGSIKNETWNAFVGELFLIAVAPELVGFFVRDTFVVRDIDAASALHIADISTQDTFLKVDGRSITALSIESLPDILLNRSVNLSTNRDGKVREIAVRVAP
jgi:hypothetical protein